MDNFLHKTLIPQRAAHLIARSRLTELLNKITERQLITLSAPAGYGKTSLLIEFAQNAPFPVCWYTLDPSDQDPWEFLEYFTAAITICFPDAMKQTKALLQGQGRSELAWSITSFTQEMYAIGQEFIAIIDDWHLVEHRSEINEIISQTLRRCPNCHIILASRHYPSLPNITLLAARRQLLSINESHLRFTTTETQELLSVEGLELTDEKIEELTQKYNGWITGMLLLLQITDPDRAGLSSDVWAERQVYHYLAEQVFDLQTPQLCDFLCESSLLDELTPDHCNAYLQRNDSRRMLNLLHRHHLFVSEIDRNVLRYHPIFREFLQEHFSTINPERYRAFARRIAGIYADNSQWLLAFKLYMMIGERAAARTIIARSAEELYRSGRLETLEHWFASFSADELDAQLLCVQARVMMKRGRFEQAQLLVQLAESRMQPDNEVSVLLLQAQLTWVNGQYQEALQKALQLLNLTDVPVLRAQVLRLVGICYNRLGQPRLAIDQFQTALAIEQERGDLYEIAQLQRDIGLCYRAIGHLHLAEKYYSQADAYWASLGNLGLRAMSLNSKASIQHLAGRYREALDTFTQALHYAREAAQPSKEAVVLSCIGDLYTDLGLFDRAQAAYDDARKLTATAHTVNDLNIAHIRLLCAFNQFDEASRALQALPATTRQSHAQITELLHATITIGLGRYEEAHQQINALISRLSQADPSMALARAYVLRAEIIAKTQPHQPALIMETFEQAALVADQLGHDSFLVVDAQHLQPILRQALAHNWKRAANWLKRQDELAALRQSLLQVQERPSLVVRTLGVEQIIFQGEVIEFNWQKTREVFYYLLTHPEGVLLETLREMLWPDLPNKQRSERLRTAIYQLRTELSRELIESQGRQIYRLKRDLVHLDYDVEQFLDTVNNCDSSLEMLTEVVERYNGPYLPSNDAQWCLNLRSHLEQRYLYALHLIADKHLERKAYQNALVMYQRILEIDNLNEHVHAQIMVCQMGLGNRSAAINQYHHMRRVLDEELGLDPDESSAAEHLYRQLIAPVSAVRA